MPNFLFASEYLQQTPAPLPSHSKKEVRRAFHQELVGQFTLDTAYWKCFCSGLTLEKDLESIFSRTY